MNEILEKIKKHNVIFWLIFFFPVGFYYLYKDKILPKYIMIPLTILLSFILFVIIYLNIYPYTIADTKTKQNILTFEKEIGTLIQIERYDIKNENYIIYDVLTNKGRYDVFVGEEYNIYAIEQIDNEHKTIYYNDNYKYKNLYSEIIRYYGSNIPAYEIINSLGKRQILLIEEKEYIFDIVFEEVYTIYCENELIYENQNPNIRINTKVKESLFEYLPNIENAICSNINFYEDYYILYLNVDNINYKITCYTDGRIRLDRERIG